MDKLPPQKSHAPAYPRFSERYFQTLSIADLAEMDDYPIIANKGSLQPDWGFEDMEQVLSDGFKHKATVLDAREVIPHIDDLRLITKSMEHALKSGFAGVRLRIFYEGKDIECLYHFSKIELIKAVNNYHFAKIHLERLLHHLHSILPPSSLALLHQFRRSRFLDKISGLISAKFCPIWKLVMLLDETWIEDDIMNALLELEYFRRHALWLKQNPANSFDSPPQHLILPTQFFSDAQNYDRILSNISQADDVPPPSSIAKLRLRLQNTSVQSISLALLQDNHYTGMVYRAGDTSIQYGDSLHGYADPFLGRIFSLALSTASRALPSFVDDSPGQINQQGGSNGGEGSCGIAVLNFIQHTFDDNTRKWAGPFSAFFRDEALVDLLTFHCISTQQHGTLQDWMQPILFDSQSNNSSCLYEFETMYDDFNLCMPSKLHPIFRFIQQSRRKALPLNKLSVRVAIAPELLPTHSDSLLLSPVEFKPLKKELSTRITTKWSNSDQDVIELTSDSDSDISTSPIQWDSSSNPTSVEDVTHIKSENDSDIEIIGIKDEPSPILNPKKRRPSSALSNPRPRLRLRTVAESAHSNSSLPTPIIDLVTPSSSPTQLQSIKRSPLSPTYASTKLRKQSPSTSQPPLRLVVPAPSAIRINAIYDSLDDAIAAVHDHERPKGYIWRRGQSKSYANGGLKRLTMRCSSYGTHNPKHSAHLDPSDHRRGKSAKSDCTAHVNINYNRQIGCWHITTAVWDHSGHDRHIPLGSTARSQPTDEQRALIGDLATSVRQTFNRSQIADVLSKHSNGPPLEIRQITNIINERRRDARTQTKELGGDFPAILASLEKLSLDDPRWFYRVRLSESSIATSLFWMSPVQVDLARRWGDVLLNDACYNRNDVGYPLNIGIVVDGYANSRNVFYSIQATEDLETDKWMLQCYLDAVGDLHPETFLSDRHATLISVLPRVMPKTEHLYCLHHLTSNVDQRLRSMLSATNQWGSFQSDFWAVYRAVSPEEFDRQWQSLTCNYPSAAPYLASLYECREKWAWTFVSLKFTLGIQTSGRVESENRISKEFGGPKKSVKQLFDGLVARTDEQQSKYLIKVRESSRRQHGNTNLERLFAGPLAQLRKHAGPFALQTCYTQMELSVYFRTEILQLPEGIRSWNEYAISVVAEPPFEWSNNQNRSMINTFTNEDAYIGAQYLLRMTSGRGNRVQNVLRIVHQGSNKAHILLILDNSSYICDCSMGISLGLPCRHYFQALSHLSNFRFHLGVIRAR
ncbi:hypothetical protein CVT24_003754 [Panaeolus cyanescens]|uniref:SWIM-type domain-containing protein n=1 Tax=Panaeolus cyanescens TaxID=181874 RepID=A0A409YYK0_9AGAR|nr:hypothetical protein CVT24_003754 [Panaeolus cyanescens]